MSEEINEVWRRKKIADHYYDNYMEHFRHGDLGKSSKFLWGAIHNLTYALGLLDNLKLGEYKKLMDYLKSLASARRDEEMVKEIDAAEDIHINFYHNFMSADAFEYKRVKCGGVSPEAYLDPYGEVEDPKYVGVMSPKPLF